MFVTHESHLRARPCRSRRGRQMIGIRSSRQCRAVPMNTCMVEDEASRDVSSRAIDQEYFIIRAGLTGMCAVLSTVWSVLACMCQIRSEGD